MPASVFRTCQLWKEELEGELEAILQYWNQNIRSASGDFYGSVNYRNIPDENAPVGIVMVSRILWTFSAAALHGKAGYEELLSAAYKLITDEFTDKEHGGVYWSIDKRGPVDDKKQMYGLAFCIYGLSEYYKLSGEEKVLNQAIELYRLVEKYGFDPAEGGYIEALSRDWQEADDLRLSEKDMNTQKSMNTHLHIVEAYSNLYSVWDSDELKHQIIHLLEIFEKKIIDPVTGHMHLFMDRDWQVRSDSWSFGHDIEAAWLLHECASQTNCDDVRKRFTKNAFRLANAAVRGLDDDGGLFYEWNVTRNTFLKEKHWWPQAEAMVGFFKLWKLSDDNSWLEKALHTWQFIKDNLKDHRFGEWYWGIDELGNTMKMEKAGFWKCPYHNGRACMEIIAGL